MVEINGKLIDAFMTNLDFNEKIVKKGFWKYCKSFAHPLNQKKYYEVTIPSSENEGTVDLVIFAQSVSNDNSTDFYLAFDSRNIPSNQVSSYTSQTRLLLIDFKRDFYINHFQTIIDKKTNEARKMSKRYEKLLKSEKEDPETHKLLEDIKLLQSDISKLQSRQFEIIKD